MTSHQRQRGVALISVLMVVALCVILIIEIMAKQRLQVQRMQNLTERQQAYWYAIGSEQFLQYQLQKIIRDDKGVVHLGQAWAMEGLAFPLDDGVIEGQVTDLNACLNVNALYNPKLNQEQQKKRKQIFVRYLDALEIDAEQSNEDLVNNIVDWLDEDDYPIEASGYDGDMYTASDFPYLSANSLMAHINELRVIQGFTPNVLEQVQNGLCALPNSHYFNVNVNTISEDTPEVLMALLDLSKSEAESILTQRPEEGYDEIGEFWQLDEVKAAIKKAQFNKSQFTLASKFFKLVSIAYYNDVKFNLTTTFQVTGDNEVKVVARRFGGRIEREANTETE